MSATEQPLVDADTAAHHSVPSLSVNSQLSIDPSTFRNLVKSVSGRTISSQQASNLLDVFGEDLKVKISETIRGFITHHFGTK